MRFIFLILTFFYISFSFGQNRNVTITGFVYGDGVETDGVVVSNLTNGLIVSTNDDGLFKIRVSLGDTLRFSAFNLNPQEIAIGKEILQSRKMEVKMTIKIKELKEVVVQNQTITAESLGIISSDVPSYTPAERRLKTASEMNVEAGINGGTESGISLSLDAIINKISGRTKMLKKELGVERKEFLEEEVTLIYGYNYFISQYKIPKEYVRAFILYLIDDSNFEVAFLSEDNLKIELILTQKSIEFLKLLNSN